MTEAEAKAKWCPMGPSLPRPVGQERWYVPFEPKCIGADCMMWRWSDEWQSKDGTGYGHCGLAGKP